MLIEWILAKFAGQVLMQGIVGALVVFGVGQLGYYSVFEKLLKGTREWLSILGAALFTVIVLFTPWSISVVLWLLGFLITIGVAFLLRDAIKAKKTLQSYVPVVEKHVVMIDQDGYGLKPEPEYLFGIVPRFRRYKKADFESFIERLLLSAEGSQVERIVVFVHGGLTDYQKALLLAKTRRDAMVGENIYPIFILWRSGLVPCYFSHLTDFRQGRTPIKNLFYRFILAFTNIIADIGRGISRFLRTSYYQGLIDLSVLNPRIENDADNVTKYFNILRSRFCISNQPELRLWKKQDEGTDWHEGTQDVWLSGDWRPRLEIFNPVKFAFRYAVWPLSDALGTSAWDIMLRRTHTLFRSPYEFDVVAGEVNTAGSDSSSSVPPYAPEPEDLPPPTRYTQMLETRPSGGLSLFVEAFMAKGLDSQVTLIGHSMGAIVVSRWLDMFPAFKAREVVLLAAACTIKDGLTSLSTYLQKHSEATGHILTLHPKAERTEQHLLGLTPLGSLLEWIDAFFSKPLTFDQRTLGKWDNLLQSTHIIDKSVRNRMHLKCFSVRSDAFDLSEAEQVACRRFDARHAGAFAGQPMLDHKRDVSNRDVMPPVTHGDFSFCKFWQPAFYTVRDCD